MNLFIEVFWSFLKIGAFAYGGGLAMLPLIQREVVRLHGWLTGDEFLNIIAISQMTPGPIAINAATFVGFKVGGVGAALVATFGVTILSIILAIVLARHLKTFEESKWVAWILSGLRPMVIALIFSAAFTIARDVLVDVKSILIFLVLGGVYAKTSWHPIGMIALGAVVGILVF
jgi:chromate transporter